MKNIFVLPSIVGATLDYNVLENKAAIDGVTLTSNTTKADLGLTGLYTYKGTKPTYADLPTTGNKVGDVWNVDANGANYAWDGSAWDKLSETIDLSSYATKAGDNTFSGNNTFSNDITVNGFNSSDHLTVTIGNTTYTLVDTNNIGSYVKAPSIAYYSGLTVATVDTSADFDSADLTTKDLVKVYRNGVLCRPNKGANLYDYSLSGTTVVFNSALSADDTVAVEVYYI